jgi:hypothetical protein
LHQGLLDVAVVLLYLSLAWVSIPAHTHHRTFYH